MGEPGDAIAVVIPVRNDAAGLGDAVRSILAQTGVDLAAIAVAVGPSTDGSLERANELAAAHAEVIVVDNPTGEISAGLNLAVAATTAPLIARVDARTELPPGYLAQATRTLRAKGALNVGAMQMHEGESWVQRGIAAALRSPMGSGGAAYKSSNELRQADTGFLGFFPRDALAAVGGWDEAMLRNEDADLNARLLAHTNDCVWVDPELRVRYLPRRSLGALARQYFAYGRWRAITWKRHPHVRGLRQMIPVAFTAALIVALLLLALTPWPLVVVAGSYLLALVVNTATLVPRAWRELPVAFVVPPVTHLSWGLGFLVSLVRPPTGAPRS